MDKTSVKPRRKILVVDDEYSIREALNLFLTLKGYDVKITEDGSTALDILNKEDFDVVVSDVRMKNMDGVILVKSLKKRDKKTPVIFMTAYPEIDSAIEALRCGVVEYIKKPFDMENMRERVEHVIREKAMTSEDLYNKRYRDEKISFLNRLSHELRTPLTPVAGYLKLLLKKEFGDIPPRQLEVLENMSKNSERLKCTADDLIMLYEIENSEGPLILRKNSAAKIVSDTVAALEAASRSKKINVDAVFYDSIEELYCDEKKIKRVFYHLIENAIKFSPDSAEVNITVVKYSYEGNDYIKFSVSDAGEGIKGANGREIFRNFYSVNAAGDDGVIGRNSRGLGLGLTLARVVVEAHCGRIWVDENNGVSGKTTTFSFILPVI
jgi:signal transduction histidine kinase